MAVPCYIFFYENFPNEEKPTPRGLKNLTKGEFKQGERRINGAYSEKDRE